MIERAVTCWAVSAHFRLVSHSFLGFSFAKMNNHDSGITTKNKQKMVILQTTAECQPRYASHVDQPL